MKDCRKYWLLWDGSNISQIICQPSGFVMPEFIPGGENKALSFTFIFTCSSCWNSTTFQWKILCQLLSCGFFLLRITAPKNQTKGKHCKDFPQFWMNTVIYVCGQDQFWDGDWYQWSVYFVYSNIGLECRIHGMANAHLSIRLPTFSLGFSLCVCNCICVIQMRYLGVYLYLYF